MFLHPVKIRKLARVAAPVSNPHSGQSRVEPDALALAESKRELFTLFSSDEIN